MGPIKTGTGPSYVPEPNPQSRQNHGVQPTAPPMAIPGQFLPQTIPIQPVQFPPQGSETNVMNYSNDLPNQHVNVTYQQQGGLPQVTYQQPPPSYPQNMGQTFAAPSHVSVNVQNFHEATYQAPPPYVVMPPYIHQLSTLLPVEGWRTGLFDCFDDPANALITICFPCVTFGQVAEIVDEGRTSCGTSALLYELIAFFLGVPCILSCAYRSKLRHKFGLVESPAPDWITHCLCDWCALCQEYRELQQRGWDPSLGWHGNVVMIQRQQQQQVVMVAPIIQTMIGR